MRAGVESDTHTLTVFVSSPIDRCGDGIWNLEFEYDATIDKVLFVIIIGWLPHIGSHGMVRSRPVFDFNCRKGRFDCARAMTFCHFCSRRKGGGGVNGG